MIKCSSTDEQLDNVWYIYIMEYYSAMKKQQTCDTQQIDKSQEYNVN